MTREHNALDALASVAVTITEGASYFIIFGSIVAWWWILP